MVTEGFPVGCSSCFQDDAIYMRRPMLGVSMLNSAGELAGKAHYHSKDNCNQVAKENNLSEQLQSSIDAMMTPPKSPKYPMSQDSLKNRCDSSFRRTYNEIDKRRATPCDNCALTLPKQIDMSLTPRRLDKNSPILRTRKAYERVLAPIPADQLSPPDSEYSEEKFASPDQSLKSKSKLEDLGSHGQPSRPPNLVSATSSHEHYLDYTSTHEPLVPRSFFIVRQSCLRTLSFESLPPSSKQPISYPISPDTRNFFSPTSSLVSTGGPIFFGDPSGGYTTAFTFRIPDPNVRGRHRVYALMALTTKRERAAMRAFSYLSVVFKEMAQWILTLAELELEKTESSKETDHNNTLTGSFLRGQMKPHECGSKLVFKNRGLAEIVGMPDFFIELHSRFVRLLTELRVLLRV